MIPDDEAITDKIEAYLLGQLAPAERLAFEGDIAADPLLAERVSRYRVIREARELLIADDLRQRLGEWKQGAPTEPWQRPGLLRRFWPLWLLLALILAVLLFIFFEPKPSPAPNPSTPPAPSPPTEQRSGVPGIQEEQAAPADPPSAETPQAPEGKGQNARKARPIAGALDQAGRKLSEKYREETERQVNQGVRGNNIAGKSTKTLQQLEQEYRQSKNPQVGYALAKKYLETEDYASAAPLFRLYAVDTNDADIYYEASWFLLLSLLPDAKQHAAEIAALFGACTQTDHHFSPLARRLKAEWDAAHPSR